MQIRYLTEDDYETLVGWWNDNRFPPPPRDMLPENGTGGIMVSSNGIDVCSGFLYLTNSKCAWCEFIVANFNYRDPDRADCILFLINSLKEIAKQNGFKYIYTTVKNKSLIEKYEQCGFIKGDNNSQEMVSKIE
jgi:hypothetical protein